MDRSLEGAGLEIGCAEVFCGAAGLAEGAGVDMEAEGFGSHTGEDGDAGLENSGDWGEARVEGLTNCDGRLEPKDSQPKMDGLVRAGAVDCFWAGATDGFAAAADADGLGAADCCTARILDGGGGGLEASEPPYADVGKGFGAKMGGMLENDAVGIGAGLEVAAIFGGVMSWVLTTGAGRGLGAATGLAEDAGM